MYYILHPLKETREHETAKPTAACRPEWHNCLPLSDRWTPSAERLLTV